MSTAGAHPTEADLRRRAARRALIRRSVVVAVLAIVVLAVVHTMQKQEDHGNAHVATKLVTVVKTERNAEGMHITARLDAPSPNGTSYQLEGDVPEASWKLSHTLWACYPPDDPGKGVLRTPLDPDCPNLVAGH